VFAVTLAELAGLDDETWAGIQDRILGAMGATDLLPARQVVSQLESEAGALWRPTRRGNQRVRDLQAEIRSLRGRRGDALERDRRLREVVRERDASRARLEEVRQDRHRERAAVERVQALVPIRAQLRRIAALRADAGPPELLQAMPGDPGAQLADLAERVAESSRRLEELASDMNAPGSAVAAVGERERALLARSEEITAFLAVAAGSASDRARLHELQQGLTEVERRLDAAGTQLFTVPWRDLAPEALLGIPPTELRERVRRFSAAKEERRILEAAAHQRGAPDAPPPPPSSFVGSISVLVSGLVLLGFGLVEASALATAVGGAATAVGVAFMVLWFRHKRTAGAALDAAAETAPGDPTAETGARQQIADLLADLPILPAMLTDPGELLVAGIERVRGLLNDHQSRSSAAREIQARTALADQDAKALGSALELDSALSTEAVVHILDRELHRAERLKEGADAGERELLRLQREKDRHEAERTELTRESETLSASLASLGDGDADRGVAEATGRLHAARRAGELQDELERAHPDLDEIVQRIADAEASGESWTMNDEDLAQRRARIEVLDEELERLASSAEALDRDAVHLQDGETADAVDGEIASLQEEEDRLSQERDRAWILGQLLKEADRAFREEHQPDLVRRAGAYLGHLTGGRYDRMLVDDAGDDGVFQIVGPELPAPIPLAHPVSTGTLEQAYLALRLAIVDHLDRGGESLPLFVDEVFVNWDEARAARGVELLASVAKTRQLFFFTCHPEMAGKLSEKGAHVIRLSEDAP
jgi:uncharacterized protein YhaN